MRHPPFFLESASSTARARRIALEEPSVSFGDCMLGLSTLKRLALRAYPLHVPQPVALQPEHEAPDDALPWIPDPWKAKTETLRSSSMLWQYLHAGVSFLFLKKKLEAFPACSACILENRHGQLLQYFLVLIHSIALWRGSWNPSGQGNRAMKACRRWVQSGSHR